MLRYFHFLVPIVHFLDNGGLLLLWRKGDAMAKGFSVLFYPEHVIASFQSLLLTTLVPRGDCSSIEALKVDSQCYRNSFKVNIMRYINII